MAVKTITPTPITNPTPGIASVAGRVTDIEGAPIVGATITVNGLTVTSSQAGSYRLDNIVVPAGQTSTIVTVSATRTINGIAWSGQNTADVLRDNPTANNLQVVISPTSTQGAIFGIVKDNSGNPLNGASVYVSQTVTSGTKPAFTNLSSLLDITASDGSYRFPALPPGTRYTVVAQYPGRTNATVSNVSVSTAQTTTQNFTLTTPTTLPTLPAPDGFSVISFTVPADATRAASESPKASAGIETLRQRILTRLGLQKKASADASKVITRAVSRTRAASDTLIENYLQWQYRPYDTLYGYQILRSAVDDISFTAFAVLQDPLAERFTDTAADLVAGTSYYYNLVRLNTNKTEGPVDNGNTLVTIPLARTTLVAPVDGSTTTNPFPTFQWNAVGRVALYEVLVYNKFPDYQSDTAGVNPIWTGTLTPTNNTGILSLDYGQNQNAAVEPPPLVSGQRYYFAVIGSDDVGSAFTFSAIHSFVKQ